MKFINKILLVALIVAIGACDATDLDLQDNPNAVTPDRASVNDLYNSIQLTFNGVFTSGSVAPGAAVRMFHAGGNFTYQAWTDPTTFNGLWFSTYSTLFPDIEALIPLADAAGLTVHSASARIMQAYSLMMLVDVLGDVPFSEAGLGTDAISPTPDPGGDVYGQAIALLDQAITDLEGTNASGPATDIYYGGDAARWATLAKTLQLRAAVTMRLVGGGPSVAALIAEGDLIDSADEDFQFNFGSQRLNPDSRHWMYISHYETGDGDYLSNSYMWNVTAEKGVEDPRARYYFYRKVDNSDQQDPTTYGCNFSTLPDQDLAPPHYGEVDPNLPYCYGAINGYIGRDHLNGQGIPPDGPIRTSYGLYPGGGQFDLNEFLDTRMAGTTGARGQGISPIMLSSFVSFLRAEAALTMGTGEDARALLETGIRESIAKTISFQSLVPGTFSRSLLDREGNSALVSDLFGVTDADIEAYVAFVLDEYDNTSNQLNIVMREYYIALWGNGIEAYNLFRRTGSPNNLAPALEPEPGPFPSSFFLPAVHVNRNASVSQRGDLTSPVFWDNGSAITY